jgi:NAD(P)-dependent dehydrogenase (short-subunit alcohol dehydrogenase family)
MRFIKFIDDKMSDLNGQIAVVTGANSGLGFQTAKYLAYKHATVVFACRNQEKALSAMALLKVELPQADLHYFPYDQASFASIKEFVKKIKEKFPRIHILVCNAGVYLPPKGIKTTDGISRTAGTNFFGLYYLLREIMPYLEQPGIKTRVIMMTSLAAYQSEKITPKILYFGRGGGYFQYSRSKLAINKLFHVLASGINMFDYAEHPNVFFYLVHPGVTDTNIIHHFPKWFQKLAHLVLKIFVHREDQAALGVAFLAANKYAVNGSYYGPRGLFEISGFPKKLEIPKNFSKGSGQFVYDTGKLIQKIEKGDQIDA